ncbi:MAG: TolC family protein, partial [Paramuribaculum sp.]|nr:TolC family protein [Paramuribaculum sp.]
MLALLLISCVSPANGQQPQQMSITELFRLADAQNADISASDARITVARQGEAVAKNSRLPQINASVTLSFLGDGTILDRNFSNPMRDKLPHFSNTLGVEVYQPVYTGGAITSSISLAGKETEMAANGRNITVNSVRMTIVSNYLELAKQRNLLKVYDENISLTEKLIGEMKLKYSEGIVLKNDITRYELRLSSLSYDKLATENAIRILNNNLISLLGMEPTVEIIPDIEADGSLAVQSSYFNWMETATSNSPTLKTFDISADMAHLGRKIAHSDYIPKIGLVAGDNLLGPITFEVPAINKNYNAWFVGINVKWNISSLFTAPKSTRKYDLKIAEIQTER